MKTPLLGIQDGLDELEKDWKVVDEGTVITGTKSEYLQGITRIPAIDSYFAIYEFGVNQIYNVGMKNSLHPGGEPKRI